MKTQFRAAHDWSEYKVDAAALGTLIDLVETAFPEPLSLSLKVRTVDRTDTAEDPEEARRLLEGKDALASATGVELNAFGEHEALEWMTFEWVGLRASVRVAGSDSLTAEALKNKAVDILDVGSVDPADPTPVPSGLPVVEQQVKLPLVRVRFAGTYADLHQLILDLADQVHQVRGNVDGFAILTEHGTTLKVNHLRGLSEVTSRDVKQLRHLTVQLGSSRDGPSLSLYIVPSLSPEVFGWRMFGDVTGPDEAPVRAARAAANDLLRDRGRGPQWLTGVLVGTSLFLWNCALGLSLALPELEPISYGLFGLAVLLGAYPLYLPRVELLAQGEKTRWSRWSRYILALAVAWALGSLAVPVFSG